VKQIVASGPQGRGLGYFSGRRFLADEGLEGSTVKRLYCTVSPETVAVEKGACDEG
jgi:hypothetical protein